MGNGIAHVCAMSGFPVKLMDRKYRTTQKQQVKRLKKFKTDGSETEDYTRSGKLYLARIQSYTDIKKAIVDADIVVEVVPEQISIKKAVWNEIEQEIDPKRLKQTIFATNTSSISISALAKELTFPEKYDRNAFL